MFIEKMIKGFLFNGLKYDVRTIDNCNLFLLLIKVYGISINYGDVLSIDKNKYIFLAIFLAN